MKNIYINSSSVRKLAKKHGKRVSKEFLDALDAHIERKVIICTQDHNGGRKTLDATIAHFYMGNKTIA